MATRTATLIRYANIEGLGWRRGTLATTKNGKHNPGAMVYGGAEYRIPADAHYQIRHYKDGKTVFTPAGKDFEVASSLLAKYEASRNLEASQKALGIYVAPKGDSPKSLSEKLKAYLEKKRSPLLKLSKHSIHLYETTLTGFVAHCRREHASEVTEADVLAYLGHLKTSGYARKVWREQSDGSKIAVDGPRKSFSDKSIGMRYICIRGFLRSCGVDVNKLIEAGVHKRLSAKPDPNTEPYSDEQLDLLFAACTDHYRNVFKFLLGTGMREQEAAHLKWENVDFARSEIHVVAANTNEKGEIKQQTKNRKGRKVPMFASVREQLLAWREKNPETKYVFGSRRSDLPDNHWIEYLKKFWTTAGLGDTDQAYLHRFRHTFARKSLDAGVPIDVVSKMLGHHSLEVTKVYLSGTKRTTLDPFSEKVAVIQRIQRAIDQDHLQNNFAS